MRPNARPASTVSYLSAIALVASALVSTGCGVGLGYGDGSGACTPLSYTQNASLGFLPVNSTASGGNATVYSVAQSITLTSDQAAKPITKVLLTLDKQGSPSGILPMTLSIETDSNGSGPTGTLAASGAQGTALISTIGASQSRVPFTLGTPVALTAGTRYWLRLKAPYGLSSTDYVQWYMNIDPYTRYANGSAVTETQTPGTFTQNIAGQYSSLLFVLQNC